MNIRNRELFGKTSGVSFAIRRAVLADEPVLQALHLEALLDSPSAFSLTYETELARPTNERRHRFAPGVTFVLEASSEPLGLVAGEPDPFDSSAVRLTALWVHPGLRGTGAADALVSSVKAWAANVGATEVRLNVLESNGRARRCCERAGFRAIRGQAMMEEIEDPEIEMVCSALQM